MANESQEEKRPSLLLTIRVFVGIYSLSSLKAMAYIWGNLNVYVVSYFYFRVNLDIGRQSSWIVSLFTMGCGIGILPGSYISRQLGFRFAMAGSLIIFYASMSLCYLAVQISFILFGILILLCGFSYGLTQCLEVILITIWASPEKIGRAICNVMVYQQLGNIVMTYVLSKYVNPENISPDTKVSSTNLFSQAEILDKVPYMFLIYGFIVSGFEVMACVLVWNATPKSTSLDIKSERADTQTFKKRDTSRMITSNHSYRSVEYERSECSVKKVKNLTLDDDKRDLTISKNAQNYHSQSKTEIKRGFRDELTSTLYGDENNEPPKTHRNELQTISQTLNHTVDKRTKNDTQQKIEMRNDSDDRNKQMDSDSSSSKFSPKQILKTKTFYGMVMLVAYSDVSCTIINTFYKMFGLEIYPDDDFFINMGIWMNVGVILTTWISGVMADVIGVKTTVIGNTAILCLVSAFLHLSAVINKWLYLVLGILFNGFSLSCYVLVTVCASRYFGKQNTTTVQGMALMVMYVTNTAIPPIASFILTEAGWMHLFTFVSVFNLVGLAFVVTTLGPVSHSKV